MIGPVHPFNAVRHTFVGHFMRFIHRVPWQFQFIHIWPGDLCQWLEHLQLRHATHLWPIPDPHPQLLQPPHRGDDFPNLEPGVPVKRGWGGDRLIPEADAVPGKRETADER